MRFLLHKYFFQNFHMNIFDQKFYQETPLRNMVSDWNKLVPNLHFFEDSILFVPWFLIETIFLFEENRKNSKQKTSEIQIEIS